MRLRWIALLIFAFAGVCSDWSGGAATAATVITIARQFTLGAVMGTGFCMVLQILHRAPGQTVAVQQATSNRDVTGPGHFKVMGIDNDTHLQTTEYVYAESRNNARFKVELKGVAVTKIERA